MSKAAEESDKVQPKVFLRFDCPSDNNTYYTATAEGTGWHPHTNRLMDTTLTSDIINNWLFIRKKTHFSFLHIQK